MLGVEGDRVHVQRHRHLGDAGGLERHPQAVDGLVGRHERGQVDEGQRVAEDAMHEKEGRAGTIGHGVNGNQNGIAVLALGRDRLSQLRNRWRLKQQRQWQILVETFGNLCKEAHPQQRMAARRKKVGVDIDAVDL